ncbi:MULTISPECIES: hypothetical protein [unclassified Streptomyces]|uniref:hypothetical protein n=1 Tax=unclassified Streptomyces TaxID=2593676 RepID=UPI00114CAB6A|nr:MULTISPECIES: hypothetical protein [unclassified Streptomyces]MYS21876.1 hypothetical protein [Streptomyces sp. SID4948]
MRAADWWSIEILDAEHADISAAAWRDAYGHLLAESLVTNGAASWEWFEHSWGVLLEVAFADERQWLDWKSLPGTQAALDAVPDPLTGLLVHRGHGGSSGSYVPRPPRIDPAADRESLPEPT